MSNVIFMYMNGENSFNYSFKYYGGLPSTEMCWFSNRLNALKHFFRMNSEQDEEYFTDEDTHNKAMALLEKNIYPSLKVLEAFYKVKNDEDGCGPSITKLPPDKEFKE